MDRDDYVNDCDAGRLFPLIFTGRWPHNAAGHITMTISRARSKRSCGDESENRPNVSSPFALIGNSRLPSALRAKDTRKAEWKTRSATFAATISCQCRESKAWMSSMKNCSMAAAPISLASSISARKLSAKCSRGKPHCSYRCRRKTSMWRKRASIG
jgi:hypothetical protein